MRQSAEFEAAIMARRVDIQELCAEARRLENEGDEVWELGIAIPTGWLPALAQGLEQVISVWEDDEADKRSEGLVSEDSLEDSELSELLERMRSLVRAIREVEPGNAYIVHACDGEALVRGTASACDIQDTAVMMMSKYDDPTILRFVAIEQRDALTRFFDGLWGLVGNEEG